MMWLSKKLRREMREQASADLGVTTIGGRETGVYTRGEMRDLPLCAPAGVCWQPCRGDRVVVLKGGTAGEEAFVLGVQQSAGEDLQDGEVRLFSKGASLCLRNDGSIELQGTVLINGMPWTPCSCTVAETDAE